MVWIHGGGLNSGSNRLNLAGTVRNLVSRGVVVVSIQYRLGFLGIVDNEEQKAYLGFFTTLTDDFPPNLGMLDQVKTDLRGEV